MTNPDPIKYIVYADGSCFDNGLASSKGGWAFIILNEDGTTFHEGCGKEIPSTNNRMELSAVLFSLAALPEGAEVEIRTDSQYVINGFVKGWIKKWRAQNYLTEDGSERKNADLWKTLDALVSDRKVTWKWVKGHSGVFHNEYVDLRAYEAWSGK